MQAREGAINALASYDQKITAGQSPVYPTADAIVFYQPRFTQYEDTLEAVTTHKELFDLDEKIHAESTELPPNFPPLIELKKQISKRYISMVNALLKKRMYKTAEKLVERSDKIEKSLDALL